MTFLRRFKGQLLFTLFLLAAVLVMPFEDYTERTFPADDIDYPEENLGVVGTENDILSVPGGAGTIIFHTDPFYLKRGSYRVTFAVKSETQGNRVEVFDPSFVGKDNTTGKILASAPVPTNGEFVSLSFSIEDYSERIQFRIKSQSELEIYHIYLLSQRGLYQDPLIYAGLILLISAFLLFYRSRRRIRPKTLIVLTFAALWSSVPLFFPWLLRGHDIFFHYGRLFNLSEDLFHTAFPIRIHPHLFHGFGYMSPVYYPELFLYPFALLGVLGMSPMGCYRLLLIAVNFATAYTSSLAFSRLFRSRSMGLIASFLYTLSMYRLINLYTRAALGEVLAAVFLPLLLLGMYQLFLGDSRKWLTAVIAFTGLLQSHLISTELALGFSVLFALCCIYKLREPKRLIRLGIAAGSTILLNLWFILPLLDHLRYPTFATEDSRNLAAYSLYAPQIFDTGINNPAGDALGRGSISGEMPLSVGLILLIGILLFLCVCTRKKKDYLSFHISLGKWCLAAGALSLYASSIYFPWEGLQRIGFINKLVGNFQFAYRFLPFATLFLSVTAAVGIYGFFKIREQRSLLFLLCAFLAVYNSGNYFSSFTNEASVYATWEGQMDQSHDSDALYLVSNNGEYVSVRGMLQQDPNFTASQGVTLSNCSRSGTKAAFTYRKTEEASGSYVDVPLNYYPCFHAYTSSGELLNTSHGELFRLRVALPEAEEDTVTIRFELPFFYRIGDIVSLLTLLGLCALTIISRKRKQAF